MTTAVFSDDALLADNLPHVVDLFCCALAATTPVAEAVVERFYVPRVAKHSISIYV